MSLQKMNFKYLGIWVGKCWGRSGEQSDNRVKKGINALWWNEHISTETKFAIRPISTYALAIPLKYPEQTNIRDLRDENISSKEYR